MNTKNRTEHILLLVASIFFIGIIPTKAVVINHDISTGSLIIQGTSTDDYVVTGATNTNKIIVGSLYQGTITLNNVNITSSIAQTFAGVLCGNGTNSVTTGSPIAIMGQNNRSNWQPVTNVNIILQGANNLQFTGANNYCGFQVDQGAQIHISSIDPNDNTSGTLESKATTIIPGSGSIPQTGAGIGACCTSSYNGIQGTGSRYNTVNGVTDVYSTTGGNIIISSGTVTAWGGHAAGIGGASYDYYDGLIVIYGGVIDARGGFDSAGIGTGCPLGTGVVPTYTTNSAIIALPPAQITAFGAGRTPAGGVGVTQFPTLGLAGTASILYINDPNKALVTIHTEDYEPYADIYADLTEDDRIVAIFDTLALGYDLSAVRFGSTDASGIFQVHAQLDQPVTFFTDASSSQIATYGRPYRPVVTTVPAPPPMEQEVILPLLDVDVSILIYPSTSMPLVEGYTAPEALDHSFRVKITYNDTDPMSSVVFSLQAGLGTDFGPLKFYAADSITEISAPTTLTNGLTFYIAVPLQVGKLMNIYSDVLRFIGTWKGLSTGYIRLVVTQRVVHDDSNDNAFIKVTANPNNFISAYPSINTVELNLNITHAGLPVTYNPLDVNARYLITTEPNYATALAGAPINTWPTLNIPSADGVWEATTASFAGKAPGVYYIHWFIVSGIVYAHSLDVISPAAQYGAFGPYYIAGLTNDLATAIEYGRIRIDILSNDAIPPASTPAGPLSGLVTEGPKAGILTDDGGYLLYKHDNSSVLANSVDSFTYRVIINSTPVEAKGYIYVIQSNKNGGFTTCRGTNYTIELKGTNVNYYWYDETGNTPLGGTNPSNTRTINNILTDQKFQIQPLRTASPYQNLPFPKALLTIKVANPDGGTAKMRWTGLFNNDWRNPENWVEVKGNYETPVSWVPSECVDVTISSNSTYYPELVDSALCNNIKIQDRALLKNPHVLRYNAASVDIKLKPAERDRYIMWSAPLKSMYSGDYHFYNGTTPQWGDVEMSYFQQDKPGGGIAAPWTLTATFGQLGEALPIGKAFNLKVTTTSLTKDKALTFPMDENSYTDTQARTYTLTRADRAKFITNDYHPAGVNGTVQMPVTSTSGTNLVQVVNPYLAYLNFNQFYSNNASLINNGYYTWDGDKNHGVTAINTDGNRYLINSIVTDNTEYIPPLQSFIVTKSVTSLTTLAMSPGWTTTNSTPYSLRATHIISGGILRIKASQGNKESYAVLAYDPEASTAKGKEDMPVIFFDEIPLTLYSLTVLQEQLSINASSDFASRETGLGLRILEIGEIKLSFTELETFGYNVVLKDKLLNKETDLNKTPEYSFTVAKAGELNDRFTLKMEYTGRGVTTNNEAIEAPALQISSSDGYISVSSNTGVINNIQIYTLLGKQIFSSVQAAGQFKVHVGSAQICVVKALIGNENKIEKVLVK